MTGVRTGEEKSEARLWGYISTDAYPYRISPSFGTLLYFRLASRIREAMDNNLRSCCDSPQGISMEKSWTEFSSWAEK